MTQRLTTAFLAVLISVALGPNEFSAQDATERNLKVFIGPQVRDGFKDIDRDIRDLVNDIRGALMSSGRFLPVATKEESLLSLEVLGRDVTRTYGPSWKERAVAVRLSVGAYEFHLIGEADSWSESAGEVVEHLEVWIDSNRQRLIEIARTQ